jgi:hypothetical protein
VAAGETATSLTVRATSTVDTGKSGTAAVTVSSGDDEDEDEGPPPGFEVYMAGYTTGWVPCYWVNDSLTLLSLPANGTEGYATGIAVSGSGDVYISGFGLDGSGNPRPGYWKTGEQSPADLPIPSPGIGGNTEAIAIVGSDVYILGFSYDEDIYNPTPCFWINGELAPFFFSGIDGEVMDFVLVSSTD